MFVNVYEIDERFSILIHLISRVTFVVFSPVPGYLVKQGYMTRIWVCYASLATIAASMLMRTGNLIGDDPFLTVAVIGMFVGGIGNTGSSVCLMPEIADSMEKQTDYIKTVDPRKLKE